MGQILYGTFRKGLSSPEQKNRNSNYTISKAAVRKTIAGHTDLYPTAFKQGFGFLS
jgi:hypothetical protein